MENLLDRISSASNNYAEIKAALVEELKEKLGSLFAPAFEQNPDVKSISWTQYTMGFNDGDPCYFSVYEIHNLNGHDQYSEYDEDDEEYDEDENIFTKIHEDSKSFDKLVKPFQTILSTIPEDYLEDSHGDGYKITVFSDGRVEEEEYYHD